MALGEYGLTLVLLPDCLTPSLEADVTENALDDDDERYSNANNEVDLIIKNEWKVSYLDVWIKIVNNYLRVRRMAF